MLLLVEIAQAAILALGFVSIVHVPQNHLLLETDMEIFCHAAADDVLVQLRWPADFGAVHQR